MVNAATQRGQLPYYTRKEGFFNKKTNIIFNLQEVKVNLVLRIRTTFVRLRIRHRGPNNFK